MSKITITIGLEDYVYHWISKQENRSAFVNDILMFAFDVMVNKNIQSTDEINLMVRDLENKKKDINNDIEKLIALKMKLDKKEEEEKE